MSERMKRFGNRLRDELLINLKKPLTVQWWDDHDELIPWAAFAVVTFIVGLYYLFTGQASEMVSDNGFILGMILFAIHSGLVAFGVSLSLLLVLGVVGGCIAMAWESWLGDFCRYVTQIWKDTE